jgi:phage tail sheath protein FI
MTTPVTAGTVPRAPGVSVEWVSADVPVPAAVRTDVAGFIGLAQRGPAHQPVRVASWSQFQAVFGGYDPRGWLAYAVNGFFANGGDACWVVRVVDPGTAQPACAALVTAAGPGAGQPAVTATATSPGSWADGTRLATVNLGGGRFSLLVDAPGTREVWPELSLDSTDPQFYGTIINDPVRGSQLVSLDAAAGASVGTGTVTLSGGADGLAGLQLGHFSGDLSTQDGPCGLAALDSVEEVGIVVIPDAVGRPAPAAAGERPPPFSAGDVTELYNTLLVSCAGHCRFALLDEFSPLDLPAAAIGWARSLRGSTAASFGSLTYPWLLGTDPLQEAGAVLAMPGSGHIAGIVARTDLTVGVHKAPANATVVGARDVAWAVDEATHGRLNAESVNVITVRPGRGIRQMGARTLDQGAAWRYVSVRRLISMIELSLEAGLAWLVFEPNTPSLQAIVEREIRAFLLGLWERGALDGAQATDAMTVRCDDTTTTPDDVAAGRLICLVGVQPPIPAEFVTVRVAVTEAGVQVVGEQGRQVARGGSSGQ